MTSESNLKSILIIINYFGQWPPWFPVFLESCKRNSTINWLFHTDCPFEEYKIDNVKFKHVSFDDYVSMVSAKLNVNFRPENSYKLCDIKPMYGVLHSDEISGFDFYGYGDIDVLYGNIRHFYPDEVLQNNNVISTHVGIVSGHLALFKNVNWIKNAYKQCKNWKAKIENPQAQRFDEDVFSTIFRYPRIDPRYFFWYDLVHPFSRRYRHNTYFQEQFTTPLTPLPWRNKQTAHPQEWYWKDGRLTNELDGDRECLYLHFMNFLSARWMDARYNTSPPWKELDKFVFLPSDQWRTRGVKINRTGFHELDVAKIAVHVEENIFQDLPQ